MKMKNKFTVMAVLALTTCLTRAEDLKKLSMDEVPSTRPTLEVDENVKVEGKGSLKITTQWPTTVCLGEVAGPDIENAKLVFKAKVKTNLDAAVLLEMWVQVGGGQYFSRGLIEVVGQKTEWKTIHTSFMFQKGQKPERVVLNLVINGKGTVWIDDIVLSKEPLK